MTMPLSESHYLADHLRRANLGGCVILGSLEGPDGAGLMLRRPDGVKVRFWIDRDPEGNGPGWAQIEPEDIRL